MTKTKYVVKTYFNEDKKKQDYSEYFFLIFYNTIIPSFSLLMAFQVRQYWFFSLLFSLVFVSFALMQIRVSLE